MKPTLLAIRCEKSIKSSHQTDSSSLKSTTDLLHRSVVFYSVLIYDHEKTQA